MVLSASHKSHGLWCTRQRHNCVTTTDDSIWFQGASEVNRQFSPNHVHALSPETAVAPVGGALTTWNVLLSPSVGFYDLQLVQISPSFTNVLPVGMTSAHLKTACTQFTKLCAYSESLTNYSRTSLGHHAFSKLADVVCLCRRWGGF